MKFGTPPPQDVIFGKSTYFNFGGGGCVKGVGYDESLFNLITPTCGKVGGF